MVGDSEVESPSAVSRSELCSVEEEEVGEREREVVKVVVVGREVDVVTLSSTASSFDEEGLGG